MKMTLRRATVDDVRTLAEMNRQLIEDERSRNPMSPTQLEARMRTWLENGWSAGLILVETRVIGYCLYQERRDDYFPEQWTIYVRQFFIERPYRGQGLGQAAFKKFAGEWFPPGATLALEVLESNQPGRRFWQRLGFEPYCTTLSKQNLS